MGLIYIYVVLLVSVCSCKEIYYFEIVVANLVAWMKGVVCTQ